MKDLQGLPIIWDGEYVFFMDDWLAVRVDTDGHESVINTECWNVYSDEATLTKAVGMPTLRWAENNCATGWCSKCERMRDSEPRLYDPSATPFSMLDKDFPERYLP